MPNKSFMRAVSSKFALPAQVSIGCEAGLASKALIYGGANLIAITLALK